MLFKKAAKAPAEISKVGLDAWYASLSEQDKVRLNRYLNDADTSSAYAFISSVAGSAVSDENHPFAVLMCEEGLKTGMTDMQRFMLTETIIEAYIGTKRYDDAKRCCESNLSLYLKICTELISMNNGKLPERICCRNRYIDIVVGVESGYDDAFGLLERFFEMGMIGEEELRFRRQSLKIHRLQRSFDGIYTYDYVK